ncbi:MAG: carboxymuconolactone decarboxylase family protein [Phycisphaeraceae bacterium]|nr:carboxymuconolactone decarboxylase family protein [Phycisphaeraceae bacterium]
MKQSTGPAPRPVTKDIVDEGQDKAFIPYPPIGKQLEHVPIHVRPELHYYIARMGFLPNTLKLYLHVPWMAEPLFRLNNALMRDERNSLPELLKYKLALVASRANECTYCTSHHCATLERRWDYSEKELATVLDMSKPADAREDVAMRFVYQASVDPQAVTDELRAELAGKFSPQEVMEIVLVVGFWKMYNTMHTAMAAPLEEPVKAYQRWMEHGVGPEGKAGGA